MGVYARGGWSRPATEAAAALDDYATTARWLAARVFPRFKSFRSAADRIGVDRIALGKYVDGTKVPPDDTVRKLAAFFGDDEGAALLLAMRSRLGSERGAELVSPDEVPEWARAIMTKLEALSRTPHAVREAHAGPYPAGPPAGAEAMRPFLASVGHGGLIPIEVKTEDVAPRLYPGWICWVDPIAPVEPDRVVCVEIDGEMLFRIVDADGRTLYTRFPDQPRVELTEAVRVVGVGRLVQHEP